MAIGGAQHVSADEVMDPDGYVDEDVETALASPVDMNRLVDDVFVYTMDVVEEVAKNAFQEDIAARKDFIDRLDAELKKAGVSEGVATTRGATPTAYYTLTAAFEAIDQDSLGFRLAFLPVHGDVFTSFVRDRNRYIRLFERAFKRAHPEDDCTITCNPGGFALTPEKLGEIPATVWYLILENAADGDPGALTALWSYAQYDAGSEPEPHRVCLIPFVISDNQIGDVFDINADETFRGNLVEGWEYEDGMIGLPVSPSQAMTTLPEVLMGQDVNLDADIFRQLAPAYLQSVDNHVTEKRVVDAADALQRRVRHAIAKEADDERIEGLLNELAQDTDQGPYRAVYDAINRERFSVYTADGCDSSRYVLMAIVTGWYELPSVLNTEHVVQQFVQPLLARHDAHAIDRDIGEPFVLSAEDLRMKGAAGQKQLVSDLVYDAIDISTLAEAEYVLDKQEVENTQDGHVLVYCVPVRLEALRNDISNINLTLQMSAAPTLVTSRPFIGEKILSSMYDIGQRLQVIGLIRRTAEVTGAFSVETQFLPEKGFMVCSYGTDGEPIEQADLNVNNALQIIDLVSALARQQGFTFFNSLWRA